MLKFRRMMGHMRDDDRGGGGGAREWREYQEAKREREKKEAKRKAQERERDRLQKIAHGENATYQDQLNYLEALRKLKPAKWSTVSNPNYQGERGDGNMTVKNWSHDDYKKYGVDKDLYKVWYDATFQHKTGIIGGILGSIKDILNVGIGSGGDILKGLGDVVKGDFSEGFKNIGQGLIGGSVDFTGAIIEGIGSTMNDVMNTVFPTGDMPEMPQQFEPLSPEYINAKLVEKEPGKVQQFGEPEIDPLTGEVVSTTDQRGRLANNLGGI